MKNKPMYKKLFCLVFSVVIACSVLTACSGDKGNNTNNNANNQNSSGNNNASTNNTSSGGSDAASTADSALFDNIRGNTSPSADEIAAVNSTLNDSYLGDIFDETIPSNYSAYPVQGNPTLTVWMPNNTILSSVVRDVNSHEVFKKAAEMTGVNLQFIVPTLGEEGTEFNLMLASGSLPDIIVDAARYTGGVAAGVREGAYLNLTDLIDSGMPNYAAYRDSDVDRRKTSMLDDGTVGAVYGLAPYSEWCWFGLLIKQEALDKTGLPVPETMDEWYDFLKACKAAGYSQPLNYNSPYGTIFTGILNGAYGVWDWVYVDKNGKAGWGPAADGAKDYLATMQKWFSEGLINRDFATADFNQRMAEAISDECAVVMDSPDTMWGYWKEDNGIDFVPALNPVLNKGDKSQQTYKNFKQTGTIAAITTTCKNPEAAMAFLDYGFTKKGWELYNFGNYGTVHLIDDSGKPYFHKDGLMYNDPEGQPLSNLIWKYRVHVFASIRDEHNSNPMISAEGSYSGDIRDYWTETMDSSVTMPPVTLTPEESAREGELGANLATLRTEYFMKIFTGQASVDTYDEFLATAKSMGLDEFIGLWQAALDRYNAR